jgi:hypothetical protein
MGKILGADGLGGKGGQSVQPGQKIATNNMNRRMNRSTKTKVVLGKPEGK